MLSGSSMLIMSPYILNMAEALSLRMPTILRSCVVPYRVTSIVRPITSVVPNSFLAACSGTTHTLLPE